MLIAQRPPGGRHPGAWEFPGGKVEPAETPQDGLARELAEEMGIAVRVGKRLATVSHDYPDLSIELSAFECDITSGEPEDRACADHRWVGPDELAGYDLLPPDVGLAVAIFEMDAVEDGRREGPE